MLRLLSILLAAFVLSVGASDETICELARIAEPAMPHPHDFAHVPDWEENDLESEVTHYDPTTKTSWTSTLTGRGDDVSLKKEGWMDADIAGLDRVDETPDRDVDNDDGTYHTNAASQPTVISTTTSYPWRAHLKLFLTWNAGNPIPGTVVCTGYMMGEFHAFTAAHCVWNQTRGGWVDSVRVIPAYTADNNGDGDCDTPYGSYWATQFTVWTAWQNGPHNFNYDFALLTLNAPIGNRVGWFGYDTGSLPSSLNYNGYSVERPYMPIGTCDQWKGFESVFSINSRRFRAEAFVYGGHSGGPWWRYTGGNRYAMGISSTSDRAGNSWQQKIRNNEIDLLQDKQNENPAPPLRPELVEFVHKPLPRSYIVSSSIVARGGTFVPRATIYNAGFAYSGTITVDFYLSTNSIISIYDTLVGTRTYSSKAPNTYFYAQPTLTVPTSLTPRVYYVGAIFRTPLLEYNENDNTMVLEERLTVV